MKTQKAKKRRAGKCFEPTHVTQARLDAEARKQQSQQQTRKPLTS